MKVLVETSARHVHLSQEHLEMMRIPHHMSTLTSSSSVHSTITQTIPLNTTEMIFGAFAVFVLVNIPNIFLILKKSILKITKSN